MTITTVQITYTEAQTIRCVARKDMPEYGLKEGQVFYCVKSASMAGYNQYHILTWDYANTRWNCPCEFGTGHNHKYACKHTNAASADCKKAHTLQGYKPLTKAQKFAALCLKYDVRYQAPNPQEQLRQAVDRQVAEIMSGDRAVVAPLNGNRAFSILR